MYMEYDTIEICQKNNILIEAYSPFAQFDKRLVKNATIVTIAEKY